MGGSSFPRVIPSSPGTPRDIASSPCVSLRVPERRNAFRPSSCRRIGGTGDWDVPALDMSAGHGGSAGEVRSRREGTSSVGLDPKVASGAGGPRSSRRRSCPCGSTRSGRTRGAPHVYSVPLVSQTFDRWAWVLTALVLAVTVYGIGKWRRMRLEAAFAELREMKKPPDPIGGYRHC